MVWSELHPSLARCRCRLAVSGFVVVFPTAWAITSLIRTHRVFQNAPVVVLNASFRNVNIFCRLWNWTHVLYLYLLSLQIFNGNHITLHYTRDWHYTQDRGAYLVYQSLLIQQRVSLSIFIPNTWKTLGSGNYVYMYSNIAAPFSPFAQRHAIGCEKFQTN